MVDALLEGLPFPVDGRHRFLEFGVGRGRLTEALLRRFPRALLLAYDRDSAVIADARERLAAFAPRLYLCLGDVTAMQPSSQRFDVICCTMSLRFVLRDLHEATRARFFSSLADRLREGGVLAVGERVRSGSPELEARYLEDRLRVMRERGWPEDVIAEERGAVIHPEAPAPSLAELRCYLSNCGMAGVLCAWSQGPNVVLFGQKPRR